MKRSNTEYAGNGIKTTLMTIGGFVLGAILAAAFTHIPGSPSDWASWTQAIVTVLAIIGAIWTAFYQVQQERKREAERQREHDLRVYHLLQSIVLRLCSSLQLTARRLADPQQGDTPPNRVKRRDELKQIQTAVNELPVHALPDFDAVEALLDTRVLVDEVVEHATKAAVSGGFFGGSEEHAEPWKDFYARANTIHEDLGTAARWLRSGVDRYAA
ncbi:hypothetical protein SAMN05444172_2600 [Burkholderia sp. GAS332]|nr:hypothetical protein SAMN05444172_2600 [Burkholderia sp. GAS332]